VGNDIVLVRRGSREGKDGLGVWSGNSNSYVNENSLVISNIYTDPTDVWPGDEMLISADVKDDVGVKSVEVEMPHEKGVDVLDMGLVEGNKFDGTWQVVWDVHDTLVKNYTSVVRVENEEGVVNYGEVEWSDSLTVNVTGDTKDGRLQKKCLSCTYADALAATPTAESSPNVGETLGQDVWSSVNYAKERHYFSFDTSNITGTVLSANLYLAGYNDYSATEFDINVYGGGFRF